MTWTRDGFEVSDDRGRLDFGAIWAYLTRSYWSPGVTPEVVEKAAAGSLPFGLYDAEGGQIGYARAVTDRATVAYLADVFVLEPYRGRGLGQWLMRCVLDHPDLRGLRRWLLTTQDAHAFYERVGFERCPFTERLMSITNPPGDPVPAHT